MIRGREEEDVVFALVIAFLMIMPTKFCQGTVQRAFAE
jgi:hypothetical protein